MADQSNEKSEVASNSETWSEAECVSGLKHLQDLQSRIDELRSALPNTIAPLAASPGQTPLSTVPPSSIYAEFAMNAINTAKEIKSLRENWENDRTKKILDYARESLEKDPDLEWEFVRKGRWEVVEDDFISVKNEIDKQDSNTAQIDGQKATAETET